MSEYKPKVGDRVEITLTALIEKRVPHETALVNSMSRRVRFFSWDLADVRTSSVRRAPVEEPPPGSAIRATTDGVRRALLRTPGRGRYHWTDGTFDNDSFEWAELEDVEVLHAAPASQE